MSNHQEKNKTFTAADIIRLMSHNLEKNEKSQVLLFYLIILPASGVVLGAIEAILETLLPPSRLFFLIIRLIKILESVWERFISVDEELLIWLLLPKETRKEAQEALDILQSDYFIFK